MHFRLQSPQLRFKGLHTPYSQNINNDLEIIEENTGYRDLETKIDDMSLQIN